MPRKYGRWPLCSRIILVFVSLPLAAEPVVETDPVVVTATRTARTANNELASVQVIDAEQIERSQARDIAQLLRFQAGLDVARNGGPGQATSVFMRGANSNHTLLLIDGVKVNTATTGGAAWQNLNPSMIERIEIVRGPRSTQYGSEAIGGVVQVFTKRYKKGLTKSVSAGYGSDSTYSGDAAVGGGDGTSYGGASLSYYDTDGFPTRTFESKDRGFTNYGLSVNGGTRYKGVDAEFSSVWARGKTEYFTDLDFDGAQEPVDQDFRNGVTALTLTATPTDIWGTSLKVSYDIDSIKQNQSDDVARTKRWTGDWQNDIQVGEYQLFTAGAYLAEEQTDAVTFGSGFYGKDKTIKAVFGQDQIDYGRGQLLLAARYTDDGFFGDKTTWNVAGGLQLGRALNLFASAGTGFRAPSSLDLFGFGGNPDLRAETSENYEAGGKYSFGASQSLQLTAFHNTIDDLIVFDFVAFELENIDKARIKGLEAQYDYAFKHWSGYVQGIVQDPENRTTGKQLLRRAKRTLTASTNYAWSRYSLGGMLLATSKRKDFGGVNLGGYAVLDMNGSVQLGKHLSLRATVENVLDKEYQQVDTFRSRGRSYFVSFSLGDD